MFYFNFKRDDYHGGSNFPCNCRTSSSSSSKSSAFLPSLPPHLGFMPPPTPYQYYFFHSTGPSLSEEYCQKIYSAAAQAAVMEDKCRVHAGLLDPDGSVFCRICFRVEILSESPRLYLCGRLKSLRLSISAGMAQWSFMGLCHSFYDIVTYTAGYSGSF